MKNLLIIGPFPPLFSYGGPTKSIKSLYDIFSKTDIQCSVLSPDIHLDGTKLKEVNVNGDIVFCKNQFFYLIRNFHRFDIIWLNSFFDPKILLLSIIKIFYNFHLIISPRGQLSSEAIDTSKPLLKKIFIKIILLFKSNLLLHSTSSSESKDIALFFKNNKISQISNLFILDYKQNFVRKRNFIFYSRIHKKKGLDILLSTIQKYNIKIELDIYGFIEDKDYWKKCEKYINDIKGVNYMGSLDDGDITKLNNKYSFFILPTLNENFGHVIIELLSIGCIPILSKNTNPFDEDISSIFNLNFDISDKSDLKNVINMANNMSDERFIKLKSSVRPYFDKLNENQEKIKKKYINFISDLL
jgi:glycosyltransferase involved in cell wall biosynthesis